MDDHLDHAKTLGDLLSGAVALGTLVQYLPQVAAAASLMWSVIRIMEWLINRLRPGEDI